MSDIKYRDEDELIKVDDSYFKKIPTDWKIIKSNHIVDIIGSSVNENKINTDGKGISYFKVDDLNCSGKQIEKSKHFVEQHGFKGKTILIPKRGAAIATNKAKIVDKEFLLDPNLMGLKVRKNCICDYYMYSLLSRGLWDIADVSTVPQINNKHINSLKFCIPAKIEQQKIVNFLDVKTTQFDNIITQKEQLIKKLEEAKKSLISEVVTGKVKIVDGQLFPRDVSEMKNSGVEWLGMIPKEWNLKPLKTIFSENKKKNIKGMENNVLSLSYGNIIRRDVESNFGLLPASFSTYQILKEGYLIFRLTDLQNDKKSLRVGLVKEKGIITNAYLGLIPSEYTDSLYMYYLFHAYDLHKVYYNMGGGLRQSMTFTDMKELKVLLPNFEEQKKLAAIIETEISDIDAVLISAKSLVLKLNQAKQSLISEAVTGKIDLRDWEIIEEGELQ